MKSILILKKIVSIMNKEDKKKELVKYCVKYQRGGRINNAVKNIGWALNHCNGGEEDAKFALFLLRILLKEVK